MIVPFFIPHAGCPHQCVFCNQKNITGQSRPADLSSIPHTINKYLKTGAKNEPAHIAFYGGSFTALPQETQKAYLEAARPFIRSGQVNGIRLSTRPDCITGEILSLLGEYHVHTVELGVQSMDDRVLTLSGRGHGAADTVHAVMLLREYAFSIGLQLMPGLPGDSAGIFQETVNKVIELKPDFVRLYPALVIQGTPLEQMYSAGRYTPLSLDEAVALCRTALVRFEEAGIPVMRIGLQPTEELERPGAVIAGPYHPAFGQLVESLIFLDKMRAVLMKGKTGNGMATLYVNASDISSATGQKRSNVTILKKEFSLRSIRIRSRPDVPRGAVR